MGLSSLLLNKYEVCTKHTVNTSFDWISKAWESVIFSEFCDSVLPDIEAGTWALYHVISIMVSIYRAVRVCVGLTCHQSRPFTMASCSRDSTVRLWSLTPLISPLLLNILTDQPWEKIIGNTGERRPLIRPVSCCSVLKPDLNMLAECLCRHSYGSRLAAAALW